MKLRILVKHRVTKMAHEAGINKINPRFFDVIDQMVERVLADIFRAYSKIYYKRKGTDKLVKNIVDLKDFILEIPLEDINLDGDGATIHENDADLLDLRNEFVK